MIDFREMPYERPDVDAYRKAMEKAIDGMEKAEDYVAARKIFFEQQTLDDRIGTLFSLCSVRNTIDTNDAYYEGEMKWLREQFAGLIPLQKRWNQALTGNPFRSDFDGEF